jgi:predicted PurR-regulated permease PerM
MKIKLKSLLKIAAVIFMLYLAIYYWPGVSRLIGAAINAASPLIVGFIIAFILNLPMKFYERNFFPHTKNKFLTHARRPICLAASAITVLSVISLIVWLIVPQLISCVSLIIADIPGAVSFILEQANRFDILPDDMTNIISSIDWSTKIGQIAGMLTSGLGNVMDIVIAMVTSVFNGIVSGLLSVIFAIYLLADKDTLTRQLRRLMDCYVPDKISKNISYFISVANDSFSSYISGQCIEALILGTLCLVGMLVLGLPYAAMISALIAFTALIPVAGAYIGAGIGAFIILMESPIKALIFIIFIIILQQLEGNLIFPKVVGSSIGLPGIWVLAAVTIGGGLMGVMGMLLGVPLAATFYKLIKNDINKKSLT